MGLRRATLNLIALPLAVMAAAGLTACATPRFGTEKPVIAAKPSGSGKRVPGTMRPYQVRGVWYTPREQPNYNEVGIASWYGQQFHNKTTANGEIFDMWVISAAHKTLPIPCIVEVTNLENGRKIRVRVNDRGPFVEGRIIDMSRAGADALGFSGKGVARVRVRYIGPAPARGSDRTLRYAGAAEETRPPPAPMRAQGPLAVQAAAFANRENAERAVNSLSGVGRARIEPLRRDGQTLYRVVVGPVNGAEEAARLREAVADVGFPQARVVDNP